MRRRKWVVPREFVSHAIVTETQVSVTYPRQALELPPELARAIQDMLELIERQKKAPAPAEIRTELELYERFLSELELAAQRLVTMYQVTLAPMMHPELSRARRAWLEWVSELVRRINKRRAYLKMPPRPMPLFPLDAMIRAAVMRAVPTLRWRRMRGGQAE